MKILDFGRQAWKRPSDWITIPNPNEDEIFILFPVSNNEGNGITINVQGVGQVDWGDGTIESWDTNTSSISHSYNYTTIDAPLDAIGNKQVVIKIKGGDGTEGSYWVKFNRSLNANLNTSPYEIKMNVKNMKQSYWSYTFENLKLLRSLIVKNAKPTYMYGCFNNTKIENLVFPFNKCSGTANGLLAYVIDDRYKDITFDTTKFTRLEWLLQSSNIRSLTITGDNPDCAISRWGNGALLREINIEGKIYPTYINYLFYSNQNLRIINGFENIDFSNLASGAADYMFYNCYSLQEIVMDLSVVTSANGFINNCFSLQKLKLINIPKINIDIKYSNVTREQFIEIFDILPDASGDSTSPTLTITGCRGIVDLTDDDKAIATNKNWTLVT